MPIKLPVGSPTILRISKMLSNKTNFKSLSKAGLSLLIAAAVTAQTGCQSTLQHAESLGLHPKSSIDFAAVNPPQSKLDSGKSVEQRYNELAGLQPNQNINSIANVNTQIRAQSPTNNGFGFPSGSRSLFGSQQKTTASNAIQAPTQPASLPINPSANQNQSPPTPQSPPPPLSVRTGDLINVQKIRDSERRLGAANVFDPGSRIVLTPSNPDDPNRVAGRTVGGGSPPTSAASRVASRLQAKADDTNGAGLGNNSSGVTSAGYQQATQDGDKVKPVAYQYPELATPDRLTIPGNGLASPNIGSPNELNPLIQPFERGGNAPIPFPANYADLDVYVSETETGRINFGGAYNSDQGIVGQFTVDERNFDITRWPTSLRDLFGGTAFRGGGQHFKLELVPGQNLQRYSVSLTEPYFRGTDYSLSLSGYLFDRNFFDWDEQRLGGRIAIGRRLTPDLSISLGFRGERVDLDNARVDTSPTLNDSLGESNLFLFNAGLIRDTRDSRLNATQGTYFSATLSQAFGDHNYTRGDFDFRTYKLLYERADGTGRHTLSLGTKLGFSGSSTPIFENYFAGGFSTFRGFDFRGVGPSENGVRIGGPFQWLNTVEYQFPILADDSVRGVLFCDFGTVEQSVTLNSENFRVAPGFGLRVDIPGLGIGAPLAFDFAFPVATAEGDEEQVFSFYLGIAQ